MKVFALAVGDRTRASSRLRVWDHLDWLHQQGHEVRARYAMPPGAQKISPAVAWRLLRAWPTWVWHLLWADAVLVQECLLLAPVLWLKRLGKRRLLVFDFSDPVDTIGCGLRNRLQRLGFALTTAQADHVIVENRAYLADLRARGLQATQFYGPVDVVRYQQAAAAMAQADRAAAPAVRIGWTGSPGTLAFIEPLLPILDRLAERQDIELMLIGVTSLRESFQYLKVTLVPWTEADEFRLVPSFDLGLFALDHSQKSARRGAGKLFVYMAAGVPFIATCHGIARDVMAEAGVGFEVAQPADWEAVLAQAINDAAARVRMKADGVRRAQVAMSYQGYRRLLASLLAG